MYIRTLRLSNFRNHTALNLDAASGFVVLSGANGSGKTNILEALSLLTPGRGLRAVPFADMAQVHGDGSFAVAAQLSGDSNADALSIGTAIMADAPGKRIVQINSAPCAATRLSEWLSVVWLTPAMDRIFTDTASGRRRFLDRLVLALHPLHAGHATRYDAAMRARTKLLSGDALPDPAWLRALELQMAEHGAAVDAARHQVTAAITDALDLENDDVLAIPALVLAGENQPVGPWDADALAACLLASRVRDASAGRALTGPHRADLIAHHRTKGVAAAHSSTGEQKAMLIRIILAHATLVAKAQGRAMLLLLDEVAAHLDPLRRDMLYARLADTGAHVWMTGTDAALFDGLRGVVTRYHLAGDGIIKAG